MTAHARGNSCQLSTKRWKKMQKQTEAIDGLCNAGGDV